MFEIQQFIFLIIIINFQIYYISNMTSPSPKSAITQLRWKGQNFQIMVWETVHPRQTNAPRQVEGDGEGPDIGSDGDDEPMIRSVAQPRRQFAFEVLPNIPQTPLAWTLRLEEAIKNLSSQLGVQVSRCQVEHPKPSVEEVEPPIFKVDADAIREAMDRYPKNSRDYSFFRDCLILFYVKETNLPILNIAEEVGLSKSRLKAIIKQYDDATKAEEAFEKARLRMSRNDLLDGFLRQQVGLKDVETNSTKLRQKFLQTYGATVSVSKIRTSLKANGYSWRKLVPIQAYVNTGINIDKRQKWAQQMVQLMEQKYFLINIDETSFHETSNRSFTWLVKGQEDRKTWKQPFQNITLLAAITPNGDVYYALVKGSNNRWTYKIFLRNLAQKLDQDYPHWRQTSVVLQDNARFHTHDEVLKVIDELKMPMFNSAPASFRAIPVEAFFSTVKAKFRAVQEEAMICAKSEQIPRPRGNKTQQICSSIEKAIDLTSREIIKKHYVAQLSQLWRLLQKEKM